MSLVPFVQISSYHPSIACGPDEIPGPTGSDCICRKGLYRGGPNGTCIPCPNDYYFSDALGTCVHNNVCPGQKCTDTTRTTSIPKPINDDCPASHPIDASEFEWFGYEVTIDDHEYVGGACTRKGSKCSPSDLAHNVVVPLQIATAGNYTVLGGIPIVPVIAGIAIGAVGVLALGRFF